MSINAGGMDGDADYSDFRTQMVHFELAGNATNAAFTDQGYAAQAVIEPLQGRGGLANNEVAELMYLETDIQLETEDDQADQDVGTFIEMRGAVGINLTASEVGGFVRGSVGTANVTTDIINDEGTDTAGALANTITDNKFLQQFQTAAGPAFDDETNGVGGNYSGMPRVYEKRFRESHGRGPVLDQNDDVTVNVDLILNDVTIQCVATTKLTMYWDVAETSDAGRQFSVPR